MKFEIWCSCVVVFGFGSLQTKSIQNNTDIESQLQTLENTIVQYEVRLQNLTDNLTAMNIGKLEHSSVCKISVQF